MFNIIKDIAVKLLFALLVISFVLWGVPSLRNVTNAPLIKVGKKTMDINAFNEVLQNALARARQENPSFTLQDAYNQGWNTQMPQYLSQQLLLDMMASEMKLNGTREIVKKVIKSNKGFSDPKTGKFDPQLLQRYLTYTNITAKKFEAELNKELVRMQINYVLNNNNVVNDSYVHAFLARRDEERKFTYFSHKINLDKVVKKLSQDDFKKHYDDNKNLFLKDEYRDVSGIIIDKNKLKLDVKVDEKELLKIFEDRKQRLQKEDTVDVYQIVITEKQIAEELLSKVSKGKDFLSVAQEFGYDKSQIFFKDLKSSELVSEELRKAVLNAKENDIVGPFKTAFGFNVVKIIKRTKAAKIDFSQYREQILSEKQNFYVSKISNDLITKINELLDQGTPLKQTAKELSLEYNSLGSVNIKGEINNPTGKDKKINDEVTNIAFSLDVGDYSDPISLQDEAKIYFIQVDKIQASMPFAFEEVKEKIISELKDKKINEAINNFRSLLTKQIIEKKSLKDIALSYGEDVKNMTLKNQENKSTIPDYVKQQIFELPLNKISLTSGNTTNATHPNAKGEFFVVLVNDIKLNKTMPANNFTPYIKQYLGAQLDKQFQSLFFQEAQARYKVTINQAEIDKIFTAAFSQ